jgi:hypothetical protein
MQALLLLNLKANHIDSQGAQHLADGIVKNEVILIHILLVIILSTTLSHRHSPRLNLKTMKSVTEVLNICVML